jgi:hypothetical protein
VQAQQAERGVQFVHLSQRKHAGVVLGHALAKEEVGGAASSIDRIDELLSRLGSNGNDKLNPPV